MRWWHFSHLCTSCHLHFIDVETFLVWRTLGNVWVGDFQTFKGLGSFCSKVLQQANCHANKSKGAVWRGWTGRMLPFILHRGLWRGSVRLCAICGAHLKTLSCERAGNRALTLDKARGAVWDEAAMERERERAVRLRLEPWLSTSHLVIKIQETMMRKQSRSSRFCFCLLEDSWCDAC